MKIQWIMPFLSFFVHYIFARSGRPHGPPLIPLPMFKVGTVYLYISAWFWCIQPDAMLILFIHVLFSLISVQILPQAKGVDYRQNSRSLLHGIEWFWPNLHFKIYPRKSPLNAQEDNWLGADFIPSNTKEDVVFVDVIMYSRGYKMGPKSVIFLCIQRAFPWVYFEM